MTSDADKVVVVQIRISPKQAERLEKVYRIFGVMKSDVAEVALEEFFEKTPASDIKTLRHHACSKQRRP